MLIQKKHSSLKPKKDFGGKSKKLAEANRLVEDFQTLRAQPETSPADLVRALRPIKELLIAAKWAQRSTLVAFLLDQAFLDQITSYLSEIFAKEEALLMEITWICILVFSVENDCELVFDILRQTGLLLKLTSMVLHSNFEVFSNSLWALANIQNEETEYKQILREKKILEIANEKMASFEQKIENPPKTFYESYLVFLISHFGTLPVEESQAHVLDRLIWAVQILVQPSTSTKYSVDDLILEAICKLVSLLHARSVDIFQEKGICSILLTYLMKSLEGKDGRECQLELEILFNLTKEISVDLEDYFRKQQTQQILTGLLHCDRPLAICAKVLQNVICSAQTIDSFFHNGNQNCFHVILGYFSKIDLRKQSEVLEEMLFLVQQSLFFGQSSLLGNFVVDNLGRNAETLIQRILRLPFRADANGTGQAERVQRGRHSQTVFGHRRSQLRVG